MREWSDKEAKPSLAIYLEASLLALLQIAALFALALAIFSPQPVEAHPGGLAADGCHNDRKNGGRHCHRGPNAGKSSQPARSGDIYYPNCAAAREAGAAHCFLAGEEIPKELLSDITVEAAGHPTSINSAVSLAAPGGHVVFIGIPVGDVSLDNKTFQHFLRQEVSLHGSWNSFGAPYPGPQWTVTLDALATGKLRWDFMITHELTLEELPDMFATLQNDRSLFFSKIMFRP